MPAVETICFLYYHDDKGSLQIGKMEKFGILSQPGRPITSARSTRLGADYSYEDSGSCVSGEEEGGIV